MPGTDTVFRQAIAQVLLSEGGYSNHPADKGGPTNMGITQGTLSRFMGRPATIDEVKNLRKETAIEIYRLKYFHGPGIDRLPDAYIPQVLDMAIISGPKTAIRQFQEVLSANGFDTKGADGAIGPNTLKAANAAAGKVGATLNNALADRRIAYFRAIVARKPSQSVFLKGWIARANRYRVP